MSTQEMQGPLYLLAADNLNGPLFCPRYWAGSVHQAQFPQGSNLFDHVQQSNVDCCRSTKRQTHEELLLKEQHRPGCDCGNCVVVTESSELVWFHPKWKAFEGRWAEGIFLNMPSVFQKIPESCSQVQLSSLCLLLEKAFCALSHPLGDTQ